MFENLTVGPQWVLSPDDIRAIAADYGLTMVAADVSVLSGAVNGVVRVVSSRGPVVIRVHRPWTRPDRLAAIHGLRQEWDDRSGRRGDGRREGGLACGQLAATSAMMVAQRSWNTRRRSPSETASPDRATARKYWRCSAKPVQKRAAEAQAPKPRSGSYRCFTLRWSCSLRLFLWRLVRWIPLVHLGPNKCALYCPG